MEALILAFDVFCMTWICWKLFKSDERDPEKADLGFLSYRSTLDEKSNDTGESVGSR